MILFIARTGDRELSGKCSRFLEELSANDHVGRGSQVDT